MNHSPLTVYNSTDLIPLDTAVIHPADALCGKNVTPGMAAFHAKLLEVQELFDNRLPPGLLQRYGMEPLHTYATATESRRTVMMQALVHELFLNAWRGKTCI